MIDVFLIILALVWLLLASIHDIKKREVPNWLSFSLVAFALCYRAFFAVLNSELWFFLYGLAGFVVFFGLAHLFYYARLFAGGDAKLLIGLGVVLPLSSSIYGNVLLVVFFIFLLLLVGGVYGMIYSVFLVFMNKKGFVKEFNEQLRARKNMVYFSLFFAVLLLIFVLYLQDTLLLFLPLIMLAFPFLFIYAKAIEEACMIVPVKGSKITVGDLLYNEVSVGKRKIKPHWEGLNEDEVELLRKSGKRIKIKQGIPFVPAFLIVFILFVLLRNSYWGFF